MAKARWLNGFVRSRLGWPESERDDDRVRLWMFGVSILALARGKKERARIGLSWWLQETMIQDRAREPGISLIAPCLHACIIEPSTSLPILFPPPPS